MRYPSHIEAGKGYCLSAIDDTNLTTSVIRHAEFSYLVFASRKTSEFTETFFRHAQTPRRSTAFN
jgi:hypothetical protein